ncbi:manganese resistance protein MNR2, variant 2 [Coprinopsis cinerea AmutBmut pab1-1]|nr:manganese resistance protein MNR2, variant 2 [Coprinopsis cinerea AmutBmut pab1-1]
MGGRENSISDSEGRSLTPDLEDEGIHSMLPTFGASPTFSTNGNHHDHSHGHLHSLGQALSSRKSIHSHKSRSQSHKITSARSPTSPWQNLAPKDKFKAAVRKVMAMRRGMTLLGAGKAIGGEPGIDPSRPESDVAYGHIHEECAIEVVDYSAIRHSSHKMSNAEFIDLMDNEETWKAPRWAKVRWINIGGLSWDVIKALASRYALHPLALEDVFHGHSRNRSKADYYTKHLFIRVLCHELADGALDEPPPLLSEVMPRAESPDSISIDEERASDREDEKAQYSAANYARRSGLRRRPILPRSLADLPKMHSQSSTGTSQLAALLRREGQAKAQQEKRKAADAFLEKLKESGQRVHVKVTPMFMFLYRDGTVITIHKTPDLEFSTPISARLGQRDTVLRKSVDPSLLVHALLDITVDKAMQVIDEYHKKISKMERKILMKPNMKTVRALHILDGDLILHKRTLDPIKTMIFGLRRYDLDRCAALIDMSDPANKDVKVVGFISHKAKIYLADVYDHMDYILTSLDMFAGIAENLIDYSFNVASYEMNEVMRRLTLATIIFLPLSLLTGYFGMNFEPFPAVNKHTDLYFWIIALPCMGVVIPLFLFSDIKNMIHYISKRIAGRKSAGGSF